MDKLIMNCDKVTNNMTVTLNDLTKEIIAFRDARNWKQFHNSKDVALSLVLEASEVMEHFQWKNNSEIEEYIAKNKDSIGEELADVLYWVLLMCHDLSIDPAVALKNKMVKNDRKYPVEKAKGRHTKYDKL